MKKSGKRPVTVAVLLTALFLAGCGKMEANAGQKTPSLLWYEKHKVEGRQYIMVAVTEGGTYGYYYENHWLTEVFPDKEGGRSEWSVCLPERFDVRDIGMDRNGNIFLFCGDLRAEERILLEIGREDDAAKEIYMDESVVNVTFLLHRIYE